MHFKKKITLNILLLISYDYLFSSSTTLRGSSTVTTKLLPKINTIPLITAGRTRLIATSAYTQPFSFPKPNSSLIPVTIDSNYHVLVQKSIDPYLALRFRTSQSINNKIDDLEHVRNSTIADQDLRELDELYNRYIMDTLHSDMYYDHEKDLLSSVNNMKFYLQRKISILEKIKNYLVLNGLDTKAIEESIEATKTKEFLTNRLYLRLLLYEDKESLNSPMVRHRIISILEEATDPQISENDYRSPYDIISKLNKFLDSDTEYKTLKELRKNSPNSYARKRQAAEEFPEAYVQGPYADLDQEARRFGRNSRISALGLGLVTTEEKIRRDQNRKALSQKDRETAEGKSPLIRDK